MGPTTLTVEQLPSTLSANPFVRSPGLIERTLAVVMLFAFAFSLPNQWFVSVGNASAGAIEGGSSLVVVVFLGFFAAVVMSMINNWHLVLAALGREPLLPALVGLAMTSAMWSLNPTETFSASVVLAITLAVGLYFSIRFRLEETLWLTAVALALGLVASYVFIFAFPQFGLDTVNVSGGETRWSGVFVTKNELGRMGTLSALVFVFVARIRRSFVVWPLWTALALLQVVVTASATALGATAGLMVLMAVFLGFRGRKTLYGATAVAIGATVSTLTLFTATNLTTAAGFLGRGSTLTGRLPLWVDSFAFGVAERPWLGHGWLAFWTEDASFDVRIRANFVVPHAHNAFVDAWLFVGPIGVLLLLGIFVRGIIWGARNIRTDSSILGVLPIMIISYGLIFSLTETGVIRRDISFVLVVVALVTAARNKGARAPFIRAATDPVDLMTL